MKIKSIIENDKNIFKELSKEFYASGATINPYNDETNEKTFRYLTSAHHNLFGYLIISDDGNCAGYSLLTSYWCNEEGGEIVIIDELYVKKEYRQHGYAKHFINWAENHFKGRAVEMTLEVLSDNAHAIDLYSELGFAPDGFTTMTRKI